MIPDEVMKIARVLYRRHMTIDAWDQEQTATQMRFINMAEDHIAVVNQAGYVVVPKPEEADEPIMLVDTFDQEEPVAEIPFADMEDDGDVFTDPEKTKKDSDDSPKSKRSRKSGK